MIALPAFSQGTVIFNNRDLNNGIDAKILMPDGITGAGSGVIAQLWAGATEDSLAPVGVGLLLRDGAGAGYINTTGQDTSRTILGVAAGASAFVQIVAWSASVADYTTALGTTGALVGASNIFSVTTGGAGSPPSLPAALVGLQGFTLTVVPEPSVIALAVLGAGALFFRRKKA